ncbi:hypothetical protein CPU2_187 [Blattabacterium punctulatus CPU2]|uniref:Lipoprotein n=1 Tax=Blattabacterium punctulatus CPU2 TaxID=1457032 RepID=A0AAD1FRJ8_9FLAO|nr:hypothetical protein [Blattabacterium punctulatus]AWU39399.1 hypothetical protein DM780_02110 [Blattabacterium punctulatus]BBA17696.1 hypothetical protein CPU2_187 [Blattabacterium punctulatus CPU2]
MNTSMKFLIPTIFLSLGVFIVSCNDDEITYSNDPVNNTNPPESHNIPPQNPTFVNSIPQENIIPPNYTFSREEPLNFQIPDDIKPEELSKRIKDIEVKIKELEKESNFHQNQYYDMISIQKKILNETKRRKSVMRSKPYGSKEQLQAKKDFEEYKKYEKEKLKILKDKSYFLNKINQSITDSKNEQIALHKMQENLQKKNQPDNH